MTPRDPDFAARIAASFAQQGFLAHLGAELAEVAPGRCVIVCPFRAELTQQHGVFHGGLLTTLADTAAGYAAMSLLPPDGEVLSIEFKITFLRPGAGVAAVARGEVLRPGRTITACRADVLMRQADGSEILCATMLATFMAAQPAPR